MDDVGGLFALDNCILRPLLVTIKPLRQQFARGKRKGLDWVGPI
jgi:hypothetical protein